MKTKLWIALFAGLLALCIGLSIPVLFPSGNAASAQIKSQGKVLRTVALNQDQEFSVDTPGGGHNIVTVKGGKIAVTEANCPDRYCMERGYCASGSPIVCLPNQLVIEFMGQQDIDSVAG